MKILTAEFLNVVEKNPNIYNVSVQATSCQVIYLT